MVLLVWMICLQCLQHLFVEIDSPIIDFYPEDFKCDMNGKRFSWQAVVLLPFIDEQRLIETTKYVSFPLDCLLILL